jgi:hypothetical protein
MLRKVSMPALCMLIASLPALAQEKLYPVRLTNKDISVLYTSDRSGYAVEKSFQHKLTLGYPDDETMDILPSSKAQLVVFWMRIQNVSPRPLTIDMSKFTSTDDQGRASTLVSPDEAYKRMIVDFTDDTLRSKAARKLSLGRASPKRTEEDVKDDITRYSLASGTLPPGGVREGLIYFEAPPRKKFTLNVTLGDLWSKPLVFSTEKQK